MKAIFNRLPIQAPCASESRMWDAGTKVGHERPLSGRTTG